MSTANSLLEIIDGPGVSELMAGFQFAYDKEQPRVCKFTLRNARTVFYAKIAGLEHEDGSGTSFNLEAYVDGKFTDHFYYNARTRQGSIPAAVFI